MLNIILNESQLQQLAIQIATLLKNTSATNDETLLTNDVLKLCRISKPTLYAWRESGKLSYKKEGKKIYYKKNDVLALITPTK